VRLIVCENISGGIVQNHRRPPKIIYCNEVKNMAKKGFKIPGLSFSWKRAFGITKAKRKIAKAAGVPTTKAGRRNKFARLFKIK
jgi:hypothetical protein